MKTIAMIAHDGKKAYILQFANDNRKALAKCNLIATKTTGKLLQEKVGPIVERFWESTRLPKS